MNGLVLLYVESEALGLMYKGKLIGAIKSQTDHYDAWCLLELVAENLAKVEGVSITSRHLYVADLPANWTWQDVMQGAKEKVTQGNKPPSDALSLTVSIKHILPEDEVILKGLSELGNPPVTLAEDGFVIKNAFNEYDYFKGFFCDGSPYLQCLVSYMYEAGYSKLELLHSGKCFGEFDVFERN